MKKINFTSRAKKISIISGAALLCIGVLSVVLFKNGAGTGVTATPVSSASLVVASSVSVNPITGDNDSASSGAGSGTWNPAKQKSGSAPLTTVSKPTSTPSKPVVAGDSKNGQQPTNPALTDKSKKPTYTTKPKAPASYSDNSKSGSTNSNSGSGSSSGNNGSSTKSNGGSNGGGSHAGQVYVPGFGWETPTGGVGTTVGNPGDKLTGDKVGSMD